MKKKTILIIVICVLAVLIIGGLVYYFGFYRNQNNEGGTGTSGEQENSKLSAVYDELKKDDIYTFTRTVDEDNKITIARSEDKGYKESIINGRDTKYIVNDSNTYLLQEDTKRYYQYDNNVMILSEITGVLEELKDQEYEKGKEKINGKNYQYEEYSGCQDFLVNNKLYTNNENNSKTRFYYDDDELVYIKTIIGDQEEIAEVNIQYSVDDNLFNVPTDYVNAEG